ncbi:hypothetical protein RUM44_010893 [Polyplax serrata]|uniref:Cilia- and flagella-associated protein 61 N-terminal domain-containing protein n=1 Tax=Polyplax serrata TaxID=468196 RepID=A0ABR1ANH0_POLSC
MRKQRCFPNNLQKFKAPLVTPSDFPSSVSLYKDEQLLPEQFGETHDSSPKESQTHVPKKSPITHWRRAEHSDMEAVRKLSSKSHQQSNELFGEPDISDLIEKSIFSIVQFNGKHELISFLSAFSYPNIPAVPSFEWYPWLENSYRIKDASPRNSVFIHYMAWDNDYYHDFLRLTLETMFLEFTFLSHIIIIRPPKVKIPHIISELFIEVLPRDSKSYECDFDSLQTVLLCLRHSVMERLKIRLAIVEDHDDLMPIVEQHTERLRQLYGDFCMAEIIQYPGTNDRQTLVCESMGYAVGFMTINRSVDFDLLNSQFDLGGFNGLRKPDASDVPAEDLNLEEDEPMVYLPEKIDPLLNVINSEKMLTFLNWEPSLCASEEDLHSNDSSQTSLKRFNDITKSRTQLLHETLNLKLIPKFSAHALSALNVEQVTHTSGISQGLGSYSEFQTVSSAETTVQSEPSLVSLQYYNLPTYNGPPNAFCIEFFAMSNNFDDRLCHDFLEAAFEVFPDLNYCLFTIPSQAPTFPLLDSFTRVTPRPLKRFKQELYVCHKSSIMVTFMRVRRIMKSDLPEIRKLLQGIRNKESIYADVASSCFYEDSAYQGFVLICFHSIVGIAVLCNENEMEYLAHHYHVSDLIDFDLHKIDYHAILKHLIMSPIYHPHARFFLRDIMRMADVTSLYRTRYEEAENNWSSSSVINVLGHLVPVKPRRMVKYHEPSLGVNVPPKFLLHRDEPFSLYHINARICGLKKFTSNINVVIVGSSRTAFSFLEALLYSPSSAYVIYNNLTLVSPHGLGTELPSHTARDYIFPFKGKFSRFYKIQICLKTYVNFVYGVMTQINRVDKYITINNDSILPYDYLILCCGRQFVMPIPYSLVPEFKSCRRSYRPRCSLFKYLITQQNKEPEAVAVYPPNVFVINTPVDATNAFISLQYLIHKREAFPRDEKIIIYGHHLQSYLCIQALLKFGIPPHMIVLIEPFPLGCHSISCLKDPNIDNAVLKTLKSLEIEHHKGFVLYDWSFCNGNQVKTAIFHSQHRKITIKCLAMIPFERRLVSEVTFKAVNEASLVYDGKLVINSCFQTNDEYIYAAGGFTKYKRKYYASDRSHRHYNSNEVGRFLAEVIRKKIDPTVEAEKEEPSELVPNMTEPIVVSGTLPGDWNFLRIRKPGKVKEIENNTTIQEIGNILTTGDCEMSKGYGYFKLTLDNYGFVQDILCYTKDTIDVENLQILYGKHEKLLNDLLVRFDLGMIKDFYSYFREPWIYAIYHDRFKYLHKSNYELLHTEHISEKNEKIIDLIINSLKANNWQRLSKEKLKEIKTKFNQSKIKKQIIDNVLDFLYYFDEPFPMYATSRILKVLLHDSTTSLLHKTPQHDSGVKSAIKISDMIRQF